MLTATPTPTPPKFNSNSPPYLIKSKRRGKNHLQNCFYHQVQFRLAALTAEYYYLFIPPHENFHNYDIALIFHVDLLFFLSQVCAQ